MRRLPITALIATVLLTGCGGSKHSSPPAHTTSTDAPTEQNPARALRAAARSAVRGNARLSNYVLWHNQVPAWAARSTGGPALRALASSAAGRRAQDVRIRSLSQKVEVLSIDLDPSFLVAAAKVRESGRVVPYQHGRRTGRAIHLNELAKVELHRVGTSTRFVVWRVARAR